MDPRNPTQSQPSPAPEAREIPVHHTPRAEAVPVQQAAPAERAPRRRPRYVMVGGRRLRAQA